jgi:hypothetical protein
MKRTQRSLASTEARVYPAQIEWIEKRFGKKAAEQANYGWGVGGSYSTVSIATKVYGHGVLETTATWGVRGVTHEWRGWS